MLQRAPKKKQPTTTPTQPKQSSQKNTHTYVTSLDHIHLPIFRGSRKAPELPSGALWPHPLGAYGFSWPASAVVPGSSFCPRWPVAKIQKASMLTLFIVHLVRRLLVNQHHCRQEILQRIFTSRFVSDT